MTFVTREQFNDLPDMVKEEIRETWKPQKGEVYYCGTCITETHVYDGDPDSLKWKDIPRITVEQLERVLQIKETNE